MSKVKFWNSVMEEDIEKQINIIVCVLMSSIQQGIF